MSESGLLTARQLMAELGRLGVGSWKPDAARQWIREEPACPSEAPMAQGQPRLYRLADVLGWLRARAQRERAKGWSTGNGPDLVERVDAAIAHLADPSKPLASSGADTSRDQAIATPVANAPAQAEAAAPASASAAAAASKTPAGEVSPAKEQTDWAELNDVEALMQVLEGRDPRNWLAAENALLSRQKRLEAARRLVPIDDVPRAITATVTMVRGALLALESQLDVALEGCETRADRRKAVRDAIHDLLDRMSKAAERGQAMADSEGEAINA